MKTRYASVTTAGILIASALGLIAMTRQGNEVTVEPVELRALCTAADHLRVRTSYTDEQRKLENYRAIVGMEGDLIRVDFLAVARPGDEFVVGGNYEYARSTAYLINKTTFEIERIHGSR